MGDDLARDVLKRYGAMKGARSIMEPQWQEIAELVAPMRADFTMHRSPGMRRGLFVFDATPGYAAENLAAGLWGMVTNSANEWFRLRHPDDRLDRQGEVRAWCEEVQRLMYEAFSAGGQRFYAAAFDLLGDLVTFGTGLFYVAESSRPGRLFFSNRALTECVIGQDDEERVDTVYRRFQWSAWQAYERWGEEVGKGVLGSLDAGRPDELFWFLHAVQPNEEMLPGRMDAAGKAFRSVYVSEADSRVVQSGGYEDFPFMVPRWSRATRGLYGDSPAMLALPDIKTLQAMEKTQLVAAQKAADPPLLAHDENVIRSVRVTPGGITYGGVDAEGRELVRPLITGANFNLTMEMAEQKREAIRHAFYAGLLSMVATPNATATEVLARQQEQMRLMAPYLGRLTAEFHDPLILRVFNLLWTAKRLPPPPAALAAAPQIAVEYVSPLARAQKTGEAQAIVQTIQAAMPVLQVNPGAADNFDWDAILRGLADGFGLPSAMTKDPEAVKALRAAAQQQAERQAQVAQLASLAKPAADGARGLKDLMAANAAAGGAAQ